MKAKHKDDPNTLGFQQMRLAKYRGQLGDRGTDEEMYNVEEENKLVSTFFRSEVILKIVSRFCDLVVPIHFRGPLVLAHLYHVQCSPILISSLWHLETLYHQTFNLDPPKSYLLPSAFYSLVIAQFNPLFVNLASIHPSPLHRYGCHLFSSIWDRYPWSSINVSKQHYGEMMISLKVDPHNYIDLFSSIKMFWSSIKHLKQI